MNEPFNYFKDDENYKILKETLKTKRKIVNQEIANEEAKLRASVKEKYEERKEKFSKTKELNEVNRIKQMINKVDHFMKNLQIKEENQKYKEKKNLNPELTYKETINRLSQFKKKDEEMIKTNREKVLRAKSRPKTASCYIKNNNQISNIEKKPKNILTTEYILEAPSTSVIIPKTVKLNPNDPEYSKRKINSKTVVKFLIKEEIKEEEKEPLNDNFVTTKEELRNLIKDYGYDLEKLTEFQKKNKQYDISHFIHKAKILKIHKSVKS